MIEHCQKLKIIIAKVLLIVSFIFISTFLQAANYTIDPASTLAKFEINNFGTYINRGRFEKKEGLLTFDRSTKTGKISVDIFTGSVRSDTTFLDKFLSSFAMFDSVNFPSARFEADQFKFDGEKLSEVTGHFTLLGKTHPLTLKATSFNCYLHPTFKREVCSGDFETNLDRSLYGMNYGLIFGFSKWVRLMIRVEALQQ
jgi:polyisoprenoid-binding protein YceI